MIIVHIFIATETSNSKADVLANISTDIKPAAPSFSDEIKRETQRKGQRSIASSSPDCTEMSDKNQTPKTSDCKDNTVLSQPSSFEQQPSSLMSSEQSTTHPHQSGRKPCFLGGDEYLLSKILLYYQLNYNIMILFTFP